MRVETAMMMHYVQSRGWLGRVGRQAVLASRRLVSSGQARSVVSGGHVMNELSRQASTWLGIN